MFTFEDYQKAKVLKDLGYTIDTIEYYLDKYIPNELIIAYKGEKPDLSKYIKPCTLDIDDVPQMVASKEKNSTVKLNLIRKPITPYNLDKVFDNLFRNNLNG